VLRVLVIHKRATLFWYGFPFRIPLFLPIKDNMKSILKTFSIVIVSLLFINASIWEGSAAVAPSNVLPETGFYAATNSFPQNTVIRVVNLENEKTVEVTVRIGLDNPSLLILLSKEAAAVLSLPSQYTGRVRVMQSADAPLIFSELTEGKDSSGDPDRDPRTQVGSAPLLQTSDGTIAKTPLGETSANDDIVDVPEVYEPPLVDALKETTEELPVEESKETAAAPANEASGKTNPLDNAELALVPTQERPPQGKAAVPEGPEVAPIRKTEEANSASPMDVKSPEGFSAPVISELDRDKSYLQLISFRKPELVESAVTVIRETGDGDKLVIQAAGLDGQPIYRILLGPMTQEESQALLQKFRSRGYADAFIWSGNK
jgi:hypothetical protein